MPSSAPPPDARAEAAPSALAGGACLWSKRIRTGNHSHLGAYSAALDGAGNLVVAGRFGPLLDLTDVGGPVLKRDGSAYLFKLDPSGSLRWVEHFLVGDAATLPPWSVATDIGGNAYVAGQTTEGAFLVKRDAGGQRVWTRRISDVMTPAQDRQPFGLVVDVGGNVIVMGHGATATTRGTDGNLAQLSLLKFDPDGILLWNRQFRCAGRARRPRVAVDVDGNIVVSGQFIGSMVFGLNRLESSTQWDLYLAKLDVHRTHVWSMCHPAKNTTGFGVAVEPAGNVVLSGAAQKSIDFGSGAPQSDNGVRAMFLAKKDPSGKMLFATRFTGDKASRFDPASPAVDSRGATIVASYFEGAIDLGGETLRSGSENESLVLAKFGADGKCLWSRCMDGPSMQAGLCVLAGADETALVLGFFIGTLALGREPLWNDRETEDLFIAKLSTADGAAS
jgi:hypothetical protein